MSKRVTINGKDYKLVLLRVIERDEKGRPCNASIGYDDTIFDLSDPHISNEFITAFVPVDAVKGHTAH